MGAVMSIEALLRWAYVFELPKADAPSRGGVCEPWDKVSKVGEYGDVIDVNRYGVTPTLFDEGEPHPDAIVLHESVSTVSAAFCLDRPDDWSPSEDWGDVARMLDAPMAEVWRRLTMRDDLGRDVPKEPISDLVRRVAILGPQWQLDMDRPREVIETAANGQPKWFRLISRANAWTDEGVATSWHDVEVDGYNPIAKRPYPDAYRRLRLEPDPIDILLARCEYQIWVAALGAISSIVDGRMSDHEIMPAPRSSTPWIDGAYPIPRILVSPGWDGPIRPVPPIRFAPITEAPVDRMEVIRAPKRKTRRRP